MKTLEQKIQELTEKHNREVAAAKRTAEVQALTGIEDLYVNPYNEYRKAETIHIRKTDKETAIKNIKKILQLFPISFSMGDNYTLTFAGKSPVITDSPISIRWTNYDNVPFDGYELTYKTAKGQYIIFDLPTGVYGEAAYIHRKQGKHKGFGRYETIISHEMNPYFPIQNYYGGGRVCYFRNDYTEYSFLQWLEFAMLGTIPSLDGTISEELSDTLEAIKTSQIKGLESYDALQSLEQAQNLLQDLVSDSYYKRVSCVFTTTEADSKTYPYTIYTKEQGR